MGIAPDPLDTLPARLETAATHVVTDVPVGAATDTVAAVRDRLPGRRWGSLTDVAVCEGSTLLGLVTIESLMAADARATLGEVMDDTPPVVAPGVDQEVAAWRMVRHGESALAVIDDDGAFVGLVPPFAVARVLLEEHDQDLSRLGGFVHDRTIAWAASEERVRARLWHRLPWLVLGLLGAMASAAILGGFEDRLEAQVVLSFFLPAIVYMADAVGTQTETVTVRGLSVGVPIGDVVGKEALSGVLIGALIAVAFFAFAASVWGEADIALVVGLSLWASCSVASVVALVLPWALYRLGRDPAFGSGPLATVVQDLLSIVIYLAIATAVLG